MTTMNSDSESQDSDDGRRFRFESTRKDAVSIIKSSRISPGRFDQMPNYQSRSDRDRRDYERHKDRDCHSRHTSRQNSRDRDLKNEHDRRSQSHNKESKSARDSKHSKHKNVKESSHSRERSDQELKESRESKSWRDCKDGKDLRNIKESSNSRFNEKEIENPKKTQSSRERSGKRHRDKSRDRSSSDKRKASSLEKYKSHSDDFHRKVKVQLIDEIIEPRNSDDLQKISNQGQNQCTEFNISDFEIVSDTENSSFNSECSDDRIKRAKSDLLEGKILITKHKYHHDINNSKVNLRIENHPNNNNPNDISDFSLGLTSPSTSWTTERLKKDEESFQINEKTISLCNYNSSKCQNEQTEEIKVYGPTLPPPKSKICNLSLEIHRKSSDEQVKETRDIKLNVVQREFIGGSHSPSSNPVNSKGSEFDFLNSELEKEQTRIIGPSLPAHLVHLNTENNDEDDDEYGFGPALPPHLMKNKTDLEIAASDVTSPGQSNLIDVNKSVEQSETDDEDIVGPLPLDHPAAQTSIVHRTLDYRARRLQNEFLVETAKTRERKREEWMTELPPAKAAVLGLGPRKFKIRPGPDMSDRSSWTDTPQDRARKEQEKAEESLAAVARKKQIEEKKPLIEEERPVKSKKREKSLLEIHQKKMKKKKKKEEREAKEKAIYVRKPFDRETDLQINKFDDAQKKHIFMKARLLDDRFTHGSM